MLETSVGCAILPPSARRVASRVTTTQAPLREGHLLERVLAHYRVFEQLGAGGMGAVYRAHDTRLRRDVALKLLPAPLFADEISRQRLIREARLAASLNHPNICTIHEVGEADGEVYIAMERVLGRELRAAIPAGGLPTETVLKYGSQVADALAHAHREGVIHRDLKSSNVLVTPEGRLKLLDFGLARQTFERVGGDSAQSTLTSVGEVVGTPHYIAPEVLRGEPADARSDLWALGVLLYEMASGALPFEGRTGYELSAAILNESPGVLPARVPAGLRAVIARSLAKEPSQRYRTADEARAALDALSSDTAVPIAAQAPRPPGWVPAVIAAAALLATLAVIVAVWLARQKPASPPELKQRQLTSNSAGDPVGDGVISPDGKTLAVAGRDDVSLRAIETGESHPVELPAGFRFTPPFPHMNWSPDGSQLLVSGHGPDNRAVVWALPVTGGRMRKVMDDATFATFSRDGAHIAYERTGMRGTEVWYSGPNGEEPHRVTGDDSSGTITSWAVWSPTGARIVYVRGNRNAPASGVWLESCDLNGRTRVLFAPPPNQELHPNAVPAWLPDGRVLFGLADPPPNERGMNLYSLRVDPRSGVASGSPRRITQWQRLAFVAPTSVSADGKRLALELLQYQSDCYVGTVVAKDSMLRDVRRLTLDDRMDLAPSWLPDGAGILFCSNRNGTYDIFRQGLTATSAEPLVTGPGDQYGPRVSPDGAWILYREEDAGAQGVQQHARLMRMPIGGGPSTRVFDIEPGSTFRVPAAARLPCVLCEPKQGGFTFSEFDPVRGRGRVLMDHVEQAAPIWDLAPDGSAIVTLGTGDSLPVLRVRDTKSSKVRSITLDQRAYVQSVAYAVDGRSWLIVAMTEGFQLLSVDANGRTRALIPPQLWMYSSSPSPDGKHVVFTSNLGEGNIWMLEDF